MLVRSSYGLGQEPIPVETSSQSGQHILASSSDERDTHNAHASSSTGRSSIFQDIPEPECPMKQEIVSSITPPLLNQFGAPHLPQEAFPIISPKWTSARQERDRLRKVFKQEGWLPGPQPGEAVQKARSTAM